MGDKKITHEKDLEYFGQYPAPVMEQIHKLHYTNVNSTITFFGPMLYFFLRALRAEKVLEIGHAEGYTAFYLANAVKDNGIRHELRAPMYYGVDIIKTDEVRGKLTTEGLPNTILNLDSALITPETFAGVEFDVIFQDGAHDKDHVVKEMEVLYPQLKGNGRGYWIAHDCYGPAEEGFYEIMKNPAYKFEYCRLWDEIYGLAILRKMDGYDYNTRYWYENKKEK